MPDIANPFFSEVARGAEGAAHGVGFSLLLCNTMEDPSREIEALRTLEAQRVDGIVLCSSRLSDEEFGAMLARLPAVVLVNREASGSDLRSVCIDDEAGARCATRHLLRSGRRAICLSGRPACLAERPAPGARLSTCARGSGNARRSSPERRVYPAPGGRLQRCPTTPRVPPGNRCLPMLQRPGGRGRVWQACAALGRRVPEDIAVVGCDDILLAGLVTPPLTTLRSDKRALGAEAVRLLLRKLAGCADGCENVVLQPELIVRASVLNRTTITGWVGAWIPESRAS